MFRKFQLGPLVGKRTWGGLVGILGFPVLMDGGNVTAPNLAFWNEDGFIIENEGGPSGFEGFEDIGAMSPQQQQDIPRVMEIANKFGLEIL